LEPPPLPDPLLVVTLTSPQLFLVLLSPLTGVTQAEIKEVPGVENAVKE
jgi:hypothetical protein